MTWPTEAGTMILPALDPGTADKAIKTAAKILRQGGLVAFPTETVYGLGADALNEKAVAGIFRAKGRPADNPLIVHIASAEMIDDLAVNVPEEARLLARHFWPGPLTLVLESGGKVPPVTTGGLGSVALRVPRHPVALALLRESGLPVAAPSANLSGRPSPTTARHVLDDLAGRIDAVLDGGPCDVGLESTVLDIRGGNPVILRPGGVTPADISALLGKDCPVAAWHPGSSEPPLSPGQKYVHYAPRAPLFLVVGEKERVCAKILELVKRHHQQGEKVGLLLSSGHPAAALAEQVEILGKEGDPEAAAAALYDALRRFDRTSVDVIVAEGYEEKGLGLALMDRLRKAAGPRIIKV